MLMQLLEMVTLGWELQEGCTGCDKVWTCDAGAAARARQVLVVPCLVVYATWACVLGHQPIHVMPNVHAT
jgi:hypothetical protein